MSLNVIWRRKSPPFLYFKGDVDTVQSKQTKAEVRLVLVHKNALLGPVPADYVPLLSEVHSKLYQQHRFAICTLEA